MLIKVHICISCRAGHWHSLQKQNNTLDTCSGARITNTFRLVTVHAVTSSKDSSTSDCSPNDNSIRDISSCNSWSKSFRSRRFTFALHSLGTTKSIIISVPGCRWVSESAKFSPPGFSGWTSNPLLWSRQRRWHWIRGGRWGWTRGRGWSEVLLQTDFQKIDQRDG